VNSNNDQRQRQKVNYNNASRNNNNGNHEMIKLIKSSKQSGKRTRVAMPKGVIRALRSGGEKCMGKLQWKNYSTKWKQMFAKLAIEMAFMHYYVTLATNAITTFSCVTLSIRLK